MSGDAAYNPQADHGVGLFDSLGWIMGYPKDPNLKGLAAAVFHLESEPWEHGIRAVRPGDDPQEVSDWHRRHGRAVDPDGSIKRAAEARIKPFSREMPGGR